VGRGCVRETGVFLCERQERIAFSAAEATAGLFPQEENDESEDQGQADGEREWDDGHGRQWVNGGGERG